jgi:manganese-dependent inorganic pyrophosphatase
MNKTRDTYVIGHINPDTDSICAAIGYAALKNALADGERYIPLRAGELSSETRWVLEHFGAEEPLFMESISPQLYDVELQKIEGVAPDATIKSAWELMRKQDVTTLPVLGEGNKLLGIISLKDIAVNYIDSFDTHALAESRTPFVNIAKTLKGEIISGGRGCVSEGGRIIVAAGDEEAVTRMVRKGDVVIVSNRPEALEAAIKAGAGCCIVGLQTKISEGLRTLAHAMNCALISTYFDSYKAAYFINQSVPVSHYMVSEKLKLFHMSNYTEDVQAEMSKTRHIFFPVLDDDGSYVGFVSRHNNMVHTRRRLILVDHNERSQCIAGWENAEILEIIDHHRVGGIQTMAPVFFRNEPLGSTSTIVSKMFDEAGIVPDRQTAGLLCCAIISDTLLFRSPTCSDTDREEAAKLAKIAGEDMFSMAEAMFEAGEDLTGKSGEDLLGQDFKIYSAYGTSFGAAQTMCVSKMTLQRAEALTAPVMDMFRLRHELRYMFYLITDIREQSSYVFCSGDGAEELLSYGFNITDPENIRLEGVVSRKKQFIPAVLEALLAQSNER